MKTWIMASLVLACVAAVAAGSLAQDDAAPAPCSAEEHRQFDFWVGSWNVSANDKAVGTNRITAILGGCILMEEWEGKGGLNGKSFNRYDASAGVWEIPHSGKRNQTTPTGKRSKSREAGSNKPKTKKEKPEYKDLSEQYAQ